MSLFIQISGLKERVMWLEESLAGVEQEAEDMRVGMRMRRAMSESGMAVYRRFKQLSKTIQSKVKGNLGSHRMKHLDCR